MCVSVSVPTGHYVSLICACLSRAASIPREWLLVSAGPCGLSVSEEMGFGGSGSRSVHLSVNVCLCLCK